MHKTLLFELIDKEYKEIGEELKLLTYFNSKLDENFFYYDKDYHKAIGFTIHLKTYKHLPPEKLFTRYGLCGICLYQCIDNGIEFPSNPYNVYENLRVAGLILKKINKKSIEEKVMKYLKPYKRSDKKLIEALKQAREVILKKWKY